MQVRRSATALLIISAAAGLCVQAAVGLLRQKALKRPSTHSTAKVAQTNKPNAEMEARRDDYRKLKQALAERDEAKLEGIPSDDREIGLFQAKIAAEFAGLHPEAAVPSGPDADATAVLAFPKYSWDDAADVGR